MIPPIARRFVAGEDAAGALDRARELNDRDIGAICNLLGEHYQDPGDAAVDAAEYRDLLVAFDDAGLRACVSVKPTQLGLGISEGTFREHLDGIVEAAAGRDGFVWIDMEDHTTTDATLDAFEAAADDHPGTVGVCVQAYLKRTGDDLERLAGIPGKVRLVKGAYDEPPTVALRDREAVNGAFETHLEYMFREFDDGIAVGSHDPRMISRTLDLHRTHGTPFEFQMLMGVREGAQTDLARQYEVWQYVPYGGRWFSYFYRRVRERKENLAFALRAILGR